MFLSRLLSPIRRRLDALAVRRKYGRKRPRFVRLHGAPSDLHLDPRDPQAWQQLVVEPLRGRLPLAVRFWQEACTQVGPNLVLDVGTLFGERIFSTDYARRTEIHGFAQDSRREKQLRRSFREHPARDRMHLHIGRRPPATAFTSDDNPLTSVDRLLAAHAVPRAGGTLMFHMNVRGPELQALHGMQMTLAATRWSVGFLQLEAHRLRKGGLAAESLFNFLDSRFEVLVFHPTMGRARQAASSTDVINRSAHTSESIELLLLGGSPDEALENFLDRWTIGRRARFGKMRAA